jgi:hypothetical protein
MKKLASIVSSRIPICRASRLTARILPSDHRVRTSAIRYPGAVV